MTRFKKALLLLDKHPRSCLAVILSVFSVVVLGNVTRWSIWFDEAFSAYIIRFNFIEIVQYTAADVHPPLYYWLLKVWTSMVGVSELGVRSLSLVFAIVGIIGVYVLVRRLFHSSRWALAASAATAFSPMLVRFSDEARMYTLVFALVVWATYALIRAIDAPNKRWWVVYGALIAAGMYTHYFAALAWLAHWIWRWYEVRKKRQERFWTRGWMWAHALAIGLFAAWIPTAVWQLTNVQTNGFWIPPLSAYTPVDYLSNALLYREYGAVTGWWATIFYIGASAVVYLAWIVARRTPARYRAAKSLLLTMAIIPPALLVVASVPPLASTFIDRYVMFSQIILAVIAALGLALLYKTRARLAGWLAILLVITASLGIYNVYYYGNYNKNSSTSIRVAEVIEAISTDGEIGQPIIAATPWIYYEAAFYDNREHHVYFIDADTEYTYGSLEMLKNSDAGKITDLTAFSERHRYIWYLGDNAEGDIEPPISTWRSIQSVSAFDSINNVTRYRATLFDAQPNGT